MSTAAKVDEAQEGSGNSGMNTMQDTAVTSNKRKLTDQDGNEGDSNPTQASNKKLHLEGKGEQQVEAKTKLQEASSYLAKLNTDDRDKVLQWFMTSQQGKDGSNTATNDTIQPIPVPTGTTTDSSGKEDNLAGFDESIFNNLETNFVNGTEAPKLPNPTPFSVSLDTSNVNAAAAGQAVNLENLKTILAQQVTQQVSQQLNQHLSQFIIQQVNQQVVLYLNQHLNTQVTHQLNSHLNAMKVWLKRENEQVQNHFKATIAKVQGQQGVASTLVSPAATLQTPTQQLKLDGASLDSPMTPGQITNHGIAINKEPITKPHDHDVLSGRGNGSNLHKGNVAFRDLIQMHKLRYISATENEKKLISNLIVQEIMNKNPPGRFLKKNSQTGLWEETEKRVALKKTSQALREGAPDLRNKIGPVKPSETSIRVSLASPEAESKTTDGSKADENKNAKEEPAEAANAAVTPQPQAKAPTGKNGEPPSNDVADVLLSLSSRNESGNEVATATI